MARSGICPLTKMQVLIERQWTSKSLPNQSFVFLISNEVIFSILFLFPPTKTGCGFQTKERYRFGWFSMKLKLVGGDSAGVVTAYYVGS